MSPATAAKPALEKPSPALVTKEELEEIRAAEQAHTDAADKAKLAETKVKALRISLAEKVLGIRSSDELKALPPEKVQKLYAERHAAGLWKLQRGAPVFAFGKTSQGRYPEWKKLYLGELGESAANARIAETDPTYSYKVEVGAG